MNLDTVKTDNDKKMTPMEIWKKGGNKSLALLSILTEESFYSKMQ